jgi:two-component system LytT family sensor kinase
MNSTPNPLVLLGQLTGYGLSTTLAALLTVFVWRSPGAGRSGRSAFAVCATFWSLGGLLRSTLLVAGLAPQSAPVAWTDCFALSAASLWPAAFFMLWSSIETLSPSQVAAGRWLLRISLASGVLLIAGLVAHAAVGAHPNLSIVSVDPHGFGDEVRMAVAYNAFALVLAGSILMRGCYRTGPERVGVALIFLGPFLSTAVHLLWRAGLLPSGWGALAVVLVKQSVSLAILGGLFFLGRFRAADRFARLSLRVLLAWSLGILLAWLATGPLVHLTLLTSAPAGTLFASVCMLIAVSMLLFTSLGRTADRWVEQRVFGKVDPALALRQLREELSRKQTVPSVVAAAQRFLTSTLRFGARLLPTESGLVAEDLRGDSVLVRVGATEPYVLTGDLRQGKRSLLSGELDVLHQVAELVGRRLEGLEREREHIDRSRREAGLVHQLLEAELRALRAQINPHFLFNSLNTIAALVHQDPTVAEAMTLRLARVFRHVLAQTDRPFSSVGEEMQFLRAYLDIEQVRFGERLEVEFRLADSIRDSAVPSLILQPLVENAIKHGLAPKLGVCRLLIEGRAENGQILLRVQDNGVGARTDAVQQPPAGVGLRNIRERLTALYGARARLSFESKPRSGSCASVYLPLGSA